MDLTGINVPEFVQGYSLKESLVSDKKIERKSALSELRVYSEKELGQGYSIKTDRYRLIEWVHKKKTFYELYDHKYDPDENNNLVNEESYNNTKDSLTIILKDRILEVQKKPVGLGRQMLNAKPNFEPKRIFSSKKSKL